MRNCRLALILRQICKISSIAAGAKRCAVRRFRGRAWASTGDAVSDPNDFPLLDEPIWFLFTFCFKSGEKLSLFIGI
jgi:hypothetical protein